MTAPKPPQYSLRTLLGVFVALGAAIAMPRELWSILQALQSEREPGLCLAPFVCWAALAYLYWRPGFADLLFVHFLIPGLFLCVIVALGLSTLLSGDTSEDIRRYLPAYVFWTVYFGFVVGNVVGLLYAFYVTVVLGDRPLRP